MVVKKPNLESELRTNRAGTLQRKRSILDVFYTFSFCFNEGS